MQLRETADKEIQDLVREISKLTAKCHPTYNTLEDLDKGQKILNRRIETNTLTSQKEKEIIKEIAQIKNSKPLIEQKIKLQRQIDELREKQKKDSEELPNINKILGGIQQRIEAVKKQHSEIDGQKANYSQQLEQLDHKRTKIREQIAKIKEEKQKAKEVYYGQMIEYEVEQRLIRDIMWLEKTKTAYLERQARNAKYREEQRRRQELRQKAQEEREARQKRREEEQKRYEEEQAER